MFIPEKKGWVGEREKERKRKYLRSILDDLKDEIIFHTWHHVTRIPDAEDISKYQQGSDGVVGYATTPLGYLRLKNCPCSTFKLLERKVEEVEKTLGAAVDVGVCREGGIVDVNSMERGEQYGYGVLVMRGDMTKEEREDKWREQRGELFKRKLRA